MQVTLQRYILPSAYAITPLCRLAGDVTVFNSMDVWGQQQPEQGLVRFYTEDKQFRIKFDASNANVSVTIHKIPASAHCE